MKILHANCGDAPLWWTHQDFCGVGLSWKSLDHQAIKQDTHWGNLKCRCLEMCFLFFQNTSKYHQNTPLRRASWSVRGRRVVYHSYVTSFFAVVKNCEAGRVLLPQCPQGCSLQDRCWMSDCHKRGHVFSWVFWTRIAIQILKEKVLELREEWRAHMHTSSAIVLEKCASSNLLTSCKWFSIGVTALWD